MPGVKMMQMARQEGKHHAAGLGLKVSSSKSRKGWAKGKMEGKGGPLNPACPYRGVRQRQWGMWVAEIREPGKKKRLWLGTYHTADEAALIYDRASRQFYGMEGYQNLRDFPGKHDADLKVPKSNSERQQQQQQQQQSIARRLVDERPVAPSSSSSSSRLVPAGDRSGRASSSSSSVHPQLRPITSYYENYSFPQSQSESGGADRMMLSDDSNAAAAHVRRFNASSMAATAAAPSTPSSSPVKYLTEGALWRLQMDPEMKIERDEDEELPLEDCWSDCSASVTSGRSPDSRDVASSGMTTEEEPAWDNFPEILSLPSDLQLLDEKNLIYFPQLV